MDEKETENKPETLKKAGSGWEELNDEELLKARICDLKLDIKNTELMGYVREFYDELNAKGIIFHPQTYLADGWLVPDGEPVIGIPFFLSHPRLSKLEQKMHLDLEGGTKKSFKQLLRHEAGHAFNYAYLLHRKSRWKELFGPFSKEYKDTYIYRPYSRSFVRHLDNWYAQCHPDEDFAETFAVWLTPDADWRSEYKGWKALKKLEYVDKLMQRIKGELPIINKGEKCYSVSRLRITFEAYYKRKRRLEQEDFPDFHDSDLEKIFSKDMVDSNIKASKLLRNYRASILKNVSFWTGGKKFIISRLIQDLIIRCNELQLCVIYNETETVSKITAYVTSLVMNYLVTGSFKKKK